MAAPSGESPEPNLHVLTYLLLGNLEGPTAHVRCMCVWWLLVESRPSRVLLRGVWQVPPRSTVRSRRSRREMRYVSCIFVMY